MDKKTKIYFGLVAFGILLFSVFNNMSVVLSFFVYILDILFPVLLGLVLAFLFNIPMSMFERILAKVTKGRYKHGSTLISFALSLAFVLSALFFVGVLILPALCTSLVGVYDKLCEKLPVWIVRLSDYGIDEEWLYGVLSRIDKNRLIQYIAGGAGDVFGSIWSFFYSAVSGIADVGIAAVISVYVLLSKHRLKRQVRRVLFAFWGKACAKKVICTAKLVFDTYSRFFGGQFTEACILGALMYAALSLFSVPYASLIALLCGMCSFVQYIGGAFAFSLGAFFVILSEPSKMLSYILVYGVVQLVENQLIYPNVVGSSVGLGGMWTVIAAVVGGGTLGIAGMVLSIPLAAVIMELLRRKVSQKERLLHKRATASIIKNKKG